MQKIEIADIQIQDGETGGKLWKRYTITSDDGATTSTFDKKAASLKVGDIIEADIELKGKYANIKSFKLIEQAPVSSQPEPTKAVSPARINTDERIAEAVAVKAVVDLLSSKVIDMEHPLARRALEFLDQHLPLLNLPPERGDKKPVTQPYEAVQSKSSPSKPPVSSKGLAETGSPPIEEVDGGRGDDDNKPAGRAELRRLFALVKEYNYTSGQIQQYMRDNFGKENSNELTSAEVKQLSLAIQDGSVVEEADIPY